MTSSAVVEWWLSHQTTPLPPVPTRAEILNIRCSMQGLLVETSYGPTPYWEGVLAWFGFSDRQAIYGAKRRRGDRHCGLQLSGAYREPHQFYQSFPGRDWVNDLPGFRRCILEILAAGFWPLIFLAGDGLHYDPEGLTYGHDWLMEHLCPILAGLDGLIPYCVFCPGYDGIIGYDEQSQQFRPWSPEQVSAYLVWLRQQAPDCYSAIEPSAGPLNGTLPDFISAGAYDALDAILNELNGPPNDDVTWQGAARLLGPIYVRPPDQPSGDDPDAPFGPNSLKWRLRVPTPRGPIEPVAFEWDTYRWVRGRISSADVQVGREYLRRMGYPSSG